VLKADLTRTDSLSLLEWIKFVWFKKNLNMDIEARCACIYFQNYVELYVVDGYVYLCETTAHDFCWH